MSNYKEELKRLLAERTVGGNKALSIGAQVDDRGYFRKAEFNEWVTLDTDLEFKPDIEWNMNRDMFSEDSEGLHHQYRENFDYVFALNLWEYIYDPLTAHKNIHSLLKPGGVYMGSYVFVYGKHNPAGTDYLRYTDEGIEKLLRMAFFKDIQITPINCGELLSTFYHTEGMRVRKDVQHDVVGYLVTAIK